MSDHTVTLLVCIAVLSLTWLLRPRSTASRTFNRVPGPPSSSLLAGSYGFFLNQPALVTTRQWTKQYGPTFRFRGLFGVRPTLLLSGDVMKAYQQEQANRLCTSDPVALQYIMNVAVYRMPKTNVSRNRIARVLSTGLAWAEGDVHKRQRHVMTPSFIAPRIREINEYFVVGATKLVEKWQKDLSGKASMSINVIDDTSRVTLDVLGRGAFGQDLHCLENPNREVIRVYRGFMNAAFSSVSAFSLVLNEFTPTTWSHAVMRLPTQRQRNLLHRNKVANQFAEDILQAKLELINQDEAAAGDDVLANFLRANRATKAKDRLQMEEVVAQIRTLVFAGHDTTTQTLAFTLYHLALHSDFQDRVRIEARQLLADSRDDAEAYETAPLLDAAIKESMRLLPVAPTFSRITTQDEDIPLGKPLTLSDGTVLDRLPVPKGTEVLGSLSDFHRSPAIWGDDADEYRPERFLRPEGPTVDGKVIPGSFGGLLTFLTGPRTCLGWRFSVAEMQVVLAHLVAAFRFAPARPEEEMLLVNSPIVYALVDGKAQVPLIVSPA